MTDVNSGDIEEFIEYDLGKGCHENDNDDIECDDDEQGYIEEHVEMLEEYVVEEDNDVKPVIIDQIDDEDFENENDYILEDDSAEEQYINEEEIEEFEEFEEYHELDLVENQPVAPQTSTQKPNKVSSSRAHKQDISESNIVRNANGGGFLKIKEEKEKLSSGEKNQNQNQNPNQKPFKRYLLFDDLVASIVDYDGDNTPIVEFALACSELDDKLPVECGICPDVMPKQRLAKHLTTHLVEGSTNRYQCIYCEESYKDYKYLAGHARRHMGIRPYVCEICKLYFSTKQDMRVHNQRRHLEKEHICEICGKTFAQNTQLKRHRESTHEKKRRFHCDYCPKAYYKNFSLKEHIRNVHLGKRRLLSCPFCGMTCRDAHKMARHRKQMHLNQKNFKCEICNEEFTAIHYFDAHKRSIQCRNNTKRHLEEQGIQSEEDEELLVPDEPKGGVPFVLQSDQQTLDEVIMYDEVGGQLVVEQVQNEDGAISVVNHIVQQDDDEYQMNDHVITTVDGHQVLAEHISGEHILPEYMTEHIVPDTVSDFVYEVTLETQE